MSADVPMPFERSFADQIGAMLQETEKFHSTIGDWVPKLQKIVDQVHFASREACSTLPAELRDRTKRSRGRDLAPVVDASQPRWNKDDPFSGWFPVVLLSWIPESRWIVRSPLSIDSIFEMVAVPFDAQCCWHVGAVSRSHRPPSYLTVARGQFVVGLLICGDCRRRVEAKYAHEHIRWVSLNHSPIFHGDGSRV